MSNRLEHEFPAVRWQAVAQPGIDRDLVRHYVERGHQLRSEAIRRVGRASFTTLGRTVARVTTFLRCTSLSLGRRHSAGDCWRGAARSA